jgi:hypothetical protein
VAKEISYGDLSKIYPELLELVIIIDQLKQEGLIFEPRNGLIKIKE